MLSIDNLHNLNNKADTMNNIERGQRLKLAREELDLSQEEFGYQVGHKHRNTIKNWEQGKTSPSEFDVDLMESHLGINRDWLITGKGMKFLKKVKPFREPRFSYGFEKFEIIDVEILSLSGLDNTDNQGKYQLIDTIKLNKRCIEKDGKVIDKAVRVEGDSMYPTIYDQGLCGIDFDDRAPVDNGIFLIYFPDIGGSIKRLHFRSNGIEAIGDNAMCESEIIPRDILQQGLIRGRVRWIHNKV